MPKRPPVVGDRDIPLVEGGEGDEQQGPHVSGDEDAAPALPHVETTVIVEPMVVRL